MIEVHQLSKAYGPVQALKDINFEISEGEIVGLLGPNGAGKTTLIKILTGFLQPDTGSARLDGLDVLSHPLQVQARIGYLPENAPLYPELTVQFYLRMMAELRRIPAREQIGRISDAVYALGLESLLTRPIGQLSKGYRQRVGLAQAILHRPRLLILDEPTVGLDPTQIVEIRKLIKRLARDSTVLFSTHILPEVEALCDRAIILMNGELKADARLQDLASSSSTILVLEREIPDAIEALRRIDGASKIETFHTREGYPAFRIAGANGDQLSPRVYRLASEQGWPLRELKQDVRTLEAVFNELAVI